MQDFFESQDRARSRTRLLVFLFLVAVALIVLAVYAVTSFSLYLYRLHSASFHPIGFKFWDPGLFAAVSLITVLVIALGSIHKMRAVGGGGAAVAEMLGGRLLMRNTREPEEQRLLNVVEEMAIASGVQVPDVYVMDHERGINAFAAGFGVDDAVVCFTKGALKLLTRDELQGVTAHEFSHILNSDTLINIRLMGLLHGILLIGLAGQGLMRGMRHTRGRNALAGLVLGLSLYIVGSIGVLMGKIIKSAVSRQREYLADSSAVEFTRNPPGLAGALKKIGGLSGGAELLHHKAPEASHMYFCDAPGSGLLSWMETHPPLEERILRLEPAFDGTFQRVEPLPYDSGGVSPGLKLADTPKPPPLRRFAPAISGAAVLAILETAGAPMQEHAEDVRRMIEDLPDTVLEAAREPFSARALVYSLLLDRDEAVRERQLGAVKRKEPEAVYDETLRLAACLPYIKPRTRLPLMDMAMPALRMLSEEQYRAFKQTVDALIAADNKMSFFEFLLSYVVIRKLDSKFVKPKKRIAQIYSVRGLLPEASMVLSLLARVGQDTEEDAKAAFKRGAGVLSNKGTGLEFLPAVECTLKHLKAALDRMAVASPPVKRSLLAACQECIAYSGEAKVVEVELFRAVCEALGCPVPPWLSATSDS